MTERSTVDLAELGVVLSGATRVASLRGLESWRDSAEFGMTFWTAPPGTSALLDLSGPGADAPELQWSARCAELPTTRAVAFLSGPGFDGVSANFETAHRAAEAIAEFVIALTGEEAGAIEVLVFRPESAELSGPPFESAPTESVETGVGVDFQFTHRGGARVVLHLHVPEDQIHSASGGMR